MRYRSRDQIIAAILRLCSGKTPLNKTRVMYGAYLSYAQIVPYLALLLQRELIVKVDKGYSTTAKGLEFLRHYDAMHEGDSE